MTPPKPEDMTFEDALAELESIVSGLERGDVPLEETIARFERGMALARRCEDRLGEASAKVALLLREGDRVVEVDMKSGDVIGETHDPGEELLPGAAPDAPAAPPGAPFPDDDDLPF